MKSPELHKQVPFWLAVTAAGALALTGCSSSSSPAESASAASPTTASSPTGGVPCSPDIKVGDDVNPADSTALFVLAGIAELPGDKDLGRPVYVQEGGHWELAPLRRLGQTATWQIGEPMSLSSVRVFARGPANSMYDGCQLPAGVARPPQSQVVTITGTVAVLSTGQEYPSFYNGDQTADSAASAYDDNGATSLPLPSNLPGFHKLPAAA